MKAPKTKSIRRNAPEGDSTSVWNEKRESMPRAELNDFQLVHLRSLISRLESSVSFYRSAFAKAGLRAEKLGALVDLRHFPFTTKADLRDQYPFGFVAKPQTEMRRYHASSGTRGKPTLVPYTQADLASWSELVARCLFATGVRPGDIVQNAYGYGLFTGGLGLHAGIELLGASVVPASGGKSHQQVTLLKDLQARVLCCTPSYALKLVDTLEEMNVSVRDLNLKIGIFGAEPWTNELGAAIEKALQLRPFDIYGLSEIMGPGVAIQCEHHQIQRGIRRQLHIWEDHFLVEIIDPKTLMPVPDGEEGELVITTLQKEGMPLLRFRTGDVSRVTRGGCACGRTSALMDGVRARFDDMLIVRGVNVYPSEIERVLYEFPHSLGLHYQIVVQKNGALDVLVLRVEAPKKGLGPESNEQDSFTQALCSAFKNQLGISVEVAFLNFGSLERVEGKSKRVVDLRSEEAASDSAPAIFDQTLNNCV